MAHDTPDHYQNLVIYECYVRAHGPTGTFAEVEADLDRIRALGVDVLWFMPIHPIGSKARKGSLGSPYSIADYRAVNPEYGTLDDFRRLLDKAHAIGLKVMIDVVFNHTAHDAVYVREHPDWYHQGPGGTPVTSVPAWSDIIDLKHPNPALWVELIDTLKYWVELGVDGFRCDVASVVPLDFWMQARTAVATVKPGVIWLAESVHAAFVEMRRSQGQTGHSDAELYAAFDLTYDYDIWSAWQATVLNKAPLSQYLDILRFQPSMYPANAVKLRCVENHDQRRIMDLAPSPAQARAWTAFQAFNRGAFLIYGGQESAATHHPSLFEREPVDWGDYALSDFLGRLAKLKKHAAQADGWHVLLNNRVPLQAAWLNGEDSLYGVFNTGGNAGNVPVQLEDGHYVDLLTDQTITVTGGQLAMPADALIVAFAAPGNGLAPFRTTLLDFHSPPPNSEPE